MAFQTVPVNDRISGPYVASLGQTSFGFDFPAYQSSEIVVTRERAGIQEQLALNFDYSLVIDIDGAGGSVTLLDGALAADRITILGQTSSGRETSFDPRGDFTATEVNRQMNRLHMLVQEGARDLSAALRLPTGEAIPPLPSVQPNSFLASTTLSTLIWAAGALVGLPVSAVGAVLVQQSTASDLRQYLDVQRWQVFDPRDFEAVNDGDADDTASLQAAFDACGQAGGGVVELRRRYKTTGSLYLRYSNIVLRAKGRSCSIEPYGDFDTIVLGDSSAFYSTTLYGIEIKDIRFPEYNKTGIGRTIYGRNIAQCVIDRVKVDQPRRGMEFHNFNNVSLDKVFIIAPQVQFALRLTGGTFGTATQRSDVCSLNNVVLCGVGTGAGVHGIDIDGFVHTVNGKSVHVVTPGGKAAWVRNAIGSTQVPSFIEVADFEADYPQEESFRADVGERIFLRDAMLNGSKSRDNLYISDLVKSFSWHGGFASGAQRCGANLRGRSIALVGVDFLFNSSNEFSGGAFGAFAGILVGSTSRDVRITACNSGDPATSNWQKAGIEIEAGADDFTILGNTNSDNLVEIINNAGTGRTRRLIGNIPTNGGNDMLSGASSAEVQFQVENRSAATGARSRFALSTSVANAFAYWSLINDGGIGPYVIEDGGPAVLSRFFDYNAIIFRQKSLSEIGRFEASGLTMNAPIQLRSYTVGTLPAGIVGQIAYASNARKNGEGAGAGTGAQVFRDATAWRVCDTGATVAA